MRQFNPKNWAIIMTGITKKDIFDTLNEFYGKIIGPEFKEIRKKLDEHDQKFRDILDHFARIYKRLNRLNGILFDRCCH